MKYDSKIQMKGEFNVDGNTTNYNPIYKEIAELIGEEKMMRIYEAYNGMQVTFPTKLYSKEYIMEQILNRYDGTNAKELAREYGYSVRYFNKLIMESKKI